MPTKATAPTSNYKPVPAGTHVARCYRFMNLGKRIGEYLGVPKEYPETLVNFTFELPNELNTFTVKTDDGDEEVEKPYAISTRDFTLSMGAKSNLRPFVEGVIGTSLKDEEAYAFDLESLVGMTCLLTVVHKQSADGTKTYANITSASPLMKGMEEPKAVNEASIQDVRLMTLDEINALPNFIQEKMRVSDEFKARFEAKKETEELDKSDVPF